MWKFVFRSWEKRTKHTVQLFPRLYKLKYYIADFNPTFFSPFFVYFFYACNIQIRRRFCVFAPRKVNFFLQNYWTIFNGIFVSLCHFVENGKMVYKVFFFFIYENLSVKLVPGSIYSVSPYIAYEFGNTSLLIFINDSFLSRRITHTFSQFFSNGFNILMFMF